jgi:hypothetical protein
MLTGKQTIDRRRTGSLLEERILSLSLMHGDEKGRRVATTRDVSCQHAGVGEVNLKLRTLSTTVLLPLNTALSVVCIVYFRYY